MTDEQPPPDRGAEVLTALPRSRPHRRSTKRPSPPGPTGGEAVSDAPTPTTAATATARKPPAAPAARERADASAPRTRPTAPTTRTRQSGARLRQPPQPRGLPPRPDRTGPAERESERAIGGGILGTAVQAAAELTEIGLTLSARALRRAVSRLPKP